MGLGATTCAAQPPLCGTGLGPPTVQRCAAAAAAGRRHAALGCGCGPWHTRGGPMAHTSAAQRRGTQAPIAHARSAVRWPARVCMPQHTAVQPLWSTDGTLEHMATLACHWGAQPSQGPCRAITGPITGPMQGHHRARPPQGPCRAAAVTRLEPGAAHRGLLQG